MPRAAAADAARGEPSAMQGSVALQRVLRVLGAARKEPACLGQQRAYEPSIAAHQGPHEVRDHFVRLPSSSRNRTIMRGEGTTP